MSERASSYKLHDTVEFFMPMKKIPTATGQQRGFSSKNRKGYLKPAAKSARETLMAHLYRHCPALKFYGPVELTVTWAFPYSKSAMYQYPEYCIDGRPKLTKPDTDNLQKLLKDVMTDLGFWVDDCQVCYEHVAKIFNGQSGIYVKIREIPDPCYQRMTEEHGMVYGEIYAQKYKGPRKPMPYGTEYDDSDPAEEKDAGKTDPAENDENFTDDVDESLQNEQNG